MLVNVLAAHRRLGSLNLKFAAEITRLIEPIALFGNEPVCLRDLSHELTTLLTLDIHRRTTIGRRAAEILEGGIELGGFIDQTLDRILITADAAQTALD